MWYSVLLTGNTFNEYSLFLPTIEHEEYELELENFDRLTWSRVTWDSLFYRFNYKHSYSITLYKSNFLNLDILSQYKFLAVMEDNKVRILINETDKNIYIDKYFERDYKKLYLKFKEIILSLYTSSKDVIYTENTGKCCFYQFEKPKFKSISERKEYVNQLLDEINE